MRKGERERERIFLSVCTPAFLYFSQIALNFKRHFSLVEFIIYSWRGQVQTILKRSDERGLFLAAEEVAFWLLFPRFPLSNCTFSSDFKSRKFSRRPLRTELRYGKPRDLKVAENLFASSLCKMNVIQAAPPRGRRGYARGRIASVPNAQRAANILPKYRKWHSCRIKKKKV